MNSAVHIELMSKPQQATLARILARIDQEAPQQEAENAND